MPKARSRMSAPGKATKAAMGLGRVITRCKGHGRPGLTRCAARGRLEQFLRFGLGGNLVDRAGHSDRLSGAAEVGVEASQAAIAPISGLMPTMFMTRVRL